MKILSILFTLARVNSGFNLDGGKLLGYRTGPSIQSPAAKVAFIDGKQNVASVDTESSSGCSLASIGTVSFLIPQLTQNQERATKFGKAAPVENPTILQVVTQLARKCTWFADGLVNTFIVPVPAKLDFDSSSQFNNDVRRQLLTTDVLIALGLTDDWDLDFCDTLFQERQLRKDQTKDFRQCQFAIDCAKDFASFVGSYNERSPNLQSLLLPWTRAATSRRLAVQMHNLFHKWSSDEFVLGILIFLNEFSGYRVPLVKHSIDATWEKGPIQNARELYSMVSKCGDCLVDCVKDDKCRECLSVLTTVDTRDQVASYRTIVSYESDLLRDLSFCILQKNNIFECDASIPQLPKVLPIAEFRGQKLTQETARALLVGHLDDESAILEGSQKKDVSWIVACWSNEAYDKLPSQNQLFYPTAKGDGRLWYDPVFRVETLDGRHVWCKRHYGVRPQSIPGTFRFSVLDSGIASDELWTIVGVAEDLSWIVFHYAGAVAAFGQRYLGGLLCTADGKLPEKKELPKVWEAVRCAGIEPWELYCVDNNKESPAYRAAGPPPLDFYRRDVLTKRIKDDNGS